MSPPLTNKAAPQNPAEPARLSDLLWLALGLALIVGTGLWVRNPWPADEPRFALIARDMVATGDWLFPRIGGDLYPDKPPFYFWLLSLAYWLTGSIRASFLIPSFIAACTVAALVYDMARRLFGRAAGLAAALTLITTVQFALTMRGAQIDPTLCALTTLSLYALLRHLLLGPNWKWYYLGAFTAGLGVITKGVGFLPLLLLIPYALFRTRSFNNLPTVEGGAKWLLAIPAFVLGTAVWFIPMVATVAATNDPNLIAYRDEILFQQTVTRYAAAWHHQKPWYYFIVEVIPGLWLPLSLLLFWLVPKWAQALREKDARIWLPLAWVILVALFFSLSAGKRGIYIFPALPAAALAASAFLPKLFARKGVARASQALAAVLILGAIAFIIMALNGRLKLGDALPPDRSPKDFIAPFATFAVIGAIVWTATALRRPILAWPLVFASLTTVVSYMILPAIDGERSARTFMQTVLAKVPRTTELGFNGYKEQFLLYLDRPVVNFGHARWREGWQESYDAAAWLNAAPGRMLMVTEPAVQQCFGSTTRQPAGVSSGDQWFLVTGRADEDCAKQGDPKRAILYRPPNLPAG